MVMIKKALLIFLVFLTVLVIIYRLEALEEIVKSRF